MGDQKISERTQVTAPAATDKFPSEVGLADRYHTLGQIGDYLNKKIAGNSGSAGANRTLQRLTANSADQTSVTPGVVMTTTGVGVGTWKFEYTLLYQSAATTTGIRIAINHTGTVTTFQMHSDFVSTGGTAATGISDGIATGATTGLHEGHAERVINTTSKATVGVATAAANQLLVVRGLIVVSAGGDLQFKLGTEVAASAVKLMAESTLELVKVS